MKRTHRDNFVAAITGQTPESIPAVLRLDPWYHAAVQNGTLPDELKGMSLDEVQSHLGFGRSARKAKVFDKTFYDNIQFIENRDCDRIITEWRTPKGVLRRIEKCSAEDQAAGLRPHTVEYPIKTHDDYRLYAQLIQNTIFTPCYGAYLEYARQIGPEGLPMVILGPIPFHDLMMNWVGYEKGFLDLYDCPDIINETLDIANEIYKATWPIVVDSPAKLTMHGVNFDAMTTPPPIFRKYFLPYLKSFNKTLHAAGKCNAFHADGDMTGLLDLMIETDFDVADCFACWPLTRCTFAQAYTAWQDHICIWGGIPSNLLDVGTSIEQLQFHLEMLYDVAYSRNRFILGISDQALPNAGWEHIRCISNFVQQNR